MKNNWVVKIKDDRKWEFVGSNGKPFKYPSSEEAFKALQGWYGSIPSVKDFRIVNLSTIEILHPTDFLDEDEWSEEE